mmetsp:Transcript_60487/g.175171  ORF Transcript_60487/g.175171 Transcript_60487/m.175171 type:complete len:319 (-) Transcript_60487:833-1789(-)
MVLDRDLRERHRPRACSVRHHLLPRDLHAAAAPDLLHGDDVRVAGLQRGHPQPSWLRAAGAGVCDQRRLVRPFRLSGLLWAGSHVQHAARAGEEAAHQEDVLHERARPHQQPAAEARGSDVHVAAGELHAQGASAAGLHRGQHDAPLLARAVAAAAAAPRRRGRTGHLRAASTAAWDAGRLGCIRHVGAAGAAGDDRQLAAPAAPEVPAAAGERQDALAGRHDAAAELAEGRAAAAGAFPGSDGAGRIPGRHLHESARCRQPHALDAAGYRRNADAHGPFVGRRCGHDFRRRGRFADPSDDEGGHEPRHGPAAAGVDA